MKKKFLLFISVLGMSASLASCGSCAHKYGDWHPNLENGSHERVCELCGNVESHAHNFSKEGTIIKEATCSSEGVMAYTCSDCFYTYEETIAKSLVHKYDTYVDIDSNNHKVICSECGSEKTQKHTFDVMFPSEENLKSKATCESPARYYYSCKCGHSSKGTIYEQTFAYGDPLEHSIYNLAIKQNPTKMSYESLEEFDPTGLVLTYSCSKCKKTDLEATPEDGITFTYEKLNKSFRVGETYINAHFSGQTVKLNGISVSKAHNEIFNLDDLDVHCMEDVDLSDIYSIHGETKIIVKDKNNIAIKSSNLHYALDADRSPYTVYVDVEGSTEYESVSRNATIYVTHEFNEDEDDGVTKCMHCKKAAAEFYYYDLENQTVFADDVSGLKADIVKYGTIVDANTLEAPDYSNLQSGDSLLLKATYNDEYVFFNAIAIDKLINDAATFNSTLWALDNDVEGTYAIGQDIAYLKTVETSKLSTEGQLFNATLYGNNHHINQLELGSNHAGLFGTRHVDFSLIRDLSFDCIKTKASNGGLFGYVGDNIKLENITFVIGQSDACILAGVPTYSKNSLKNCIFNMGAFSDVSLYRAAGGGSDKVSFDNVTIYYTPSMNQKIFGDVNPTYTEDGINWEII